MPAIALLIVEIYKDRKIRFVSIIDLSCVCVCESYSHL